jgi:hypothetical protein
MALLRTLIVLAVLAVVVYVIYTFFLAKFKALSSCRSGTKKLEIPAHKLHGNKDTNNYAYSIWFYVSDWSHRLSEPKDLLVRKGPSNTVNPRITLAPYENNLQISVNTYPTGGSGHHLAPAPAQSQTCTINNFPLQRWVNLIVSLNNRTMDTYLDGKLVRTCILPAPAKIDPDAAVILTPDGGFKGWTSNTQYFSAPLNPQEAYNIYVKGPNCGGSGFFDKYKLKLSYLVNNQEEASLEI